MSGCPHQPKAKASWGRNHPSLSPSPTSARGNIKSKSRSQTKTQWRERLRRGCLERAKNARRERLRKSRGGDCGGENGSSNGQWGEGVDFVGSDSGSANARRDGRSKIKRCRDSANAEWSFSELNHEVIVDHTSVANQRQTAMTNHGQVDFNLHHSESGDREEITVDAARLLVEQELQLALTGLQHARRVCPLDGGIPWKKMRRGEEQAVRDVDFMESDIAVELKEMEETKQSLEDEYEISQEEFEDLLNDVAEELQREEELLEEEIWEMERAEAMERERLMHQIDDFDSWEEFQQQKSQLMHQTDDVFDSWEEFQQQQSQPNTWRLPMRGYS